MGQALSAEVFVGRSVEIGQLLGALRARDAAAPTVVVTSGEAGIGKSRLLAEFLGRARASGSIVVGGSCVPLTGGGIPYYPISQALRSLQPLLNAETRAWLDEPVHRELKQLLAGTHSLDTKPDEFAVARLFESAAGLVERVANERKLVLAIEDLHWADRSTLDLVSFLGRASDSANLLVVLTLRAEDAELSPDILVFLTELRRARRLDHIELPRFARDETASLIEAIEGDRPPGALVDEIQARSDGNPFFIEELLAGSAETRRLSPNLRDVVLAQIATLSEPARGLLCVASVAGRSVGHDLLVSVAGPGRVPTQVIREVLRRHALILEPQTDRYSFRHALVQEAVYDSLLPDERRLLHRAYAEALTPESEASAPDASDAAQLAYHWDRAGAAKDAYRSYMDAALAAASGYAYHEAHLHYQRALQIADAGGLPVDFDQLVQIADIAYEAGDAGRAAELLRRALERTEAEIPIARALALSRLTRATIALCEYESASEASEAAVQIVTDMEASPEKARVLSEHARLLHLRMRPDECRRVCLEAVATARAVGARRELAESLITLGMASGMTPDIDGAGRAISEAIQLGEELGDALLLARGANELGVVLEMADRVQEALEVTSAASSRLRAMGMPWATLVLLQFNSISCMTSLGRFEEAYLLAEEPMGVILPALAEFRTMTMCRLAAERRDGGYRVEVPSGDSLLVILAEVQIAVARSRWLAVRDATDRLLAAAGGQNSTGPVSFDKLAVYGGDDVTQLPEMWVYCLRAEAELAAEAIARGDREAIEFSERRGTYLFEALDAFPRHMYPKLRMAALLATAEAQLSRINGASDPDLWRAAVRATEAECSPQWIADARFRLAEAILGSGGSRSEAASNLRLAWEAAGEMGIQPLVEECQTLARRGRVKLVETAETVELSPGARLGLTRRELAVLELMAVGRTNREIANRLFIGEKTVATHVSNILGKLDAGNRVEAVAIARRTIPDFSAAAAGSGRAL